MFHILTVVAALGVIKAISAVIADRQKRRRVQNDIERFERKHPVKSSKIVDSEVK